MNRRRLTLEEIEARGEARMERVRLRVAMSERKAREARAAAPPAPDDDEWRQVPGFGGAYEIHRDGRVRSWKEWMGATVPLPRQMKAQDTKRGRVIQLGLHGGTHNVDQLVAEIFKDKTS